MSPAETVQVAAIVPVELAERIREIAQKNERSQAAEIRLALKAWIDRAEQDRGRDLAA